MKLTKKIKGYALALCLIAISFSAYAANPQWGAAGARNDSSLTIKEMLTYALQDEYLARAEYVAIMKKFNVTRPFDNIKAAEDSHIAWLTEIFPKYGLSVFEDTASSLVVMPANLTEAYKAGVQAEIDNIAMYERFLATPEVADKANADLKNLFTRLKKASENHLKAFQNQLSRNK